MVQTASDERSTPAAQERHKEREVLIERGIPTPERVRGKGRGEISNAIRALACAQIGDSILIKNKTTKQLGPYIASAGHGFGWAVTRSVSEGTRVWKFAEPTK